MPYIGEVRMFAGTFAPVGWVFCNGQSLPISQYVALFNLIGTTYGGDGVNNFNVPDLQSRVPIGTGQQPGFLNYLLGQTGGVESNILTIATMPSHTHTVTGSASLLTSSEDGHSTSPAATYPAVNGQNLYSTTTDNSVMAAATATLTAGTAGTGAPQPVSNIQPYLAITYIICTDGIYPTTN
jgi:microcystin-dependent protein